MSTPPREYEYELNQVEVLAKNILGPSRSTAGPQIFALVGELGAGKTTLVAALCRALGVEEPTSSPTFSIVNEYRGAGVAVYHLDCYRIDSLEEALAAGLEDIFQQTEAWVFVEWPGVIEPLLPADVTVLRLGHAGGGQSRRLSVVRP